MGIGSGLNLPLYGPRITEIIGLDPSSKLIAMGSKHSGASGQPVTFLRGSAEAIPLDTASIDTVLTTWTMCSIPDASAALSEMRRVLKPGGDLLFVEHGRAPDASVARWQDWLDPAWRPLAGGCHLNRPIAELISGAGFRFVDLRTGYLGPTARVQVHVRRCCPARLNNRPRERDKQHVRQYGSAVDIDKRDLQPLAEHGEHEAAHGAHENLEHRSSRQAPRRGSAKPTTLRRGSRTRCRSWPHHRNGSRTYRQVFDATKT